jgi:hypothetical protein
MILGTLERQVYSYFKEKEPFQVLETTRREIAEYCGYSESSNVTEEAFMESVGRAIRCLHEKGLLNLRVQHGPYGGYEVSCANPLPSHVKIKSDSMTIGAGDKAQEKALSGINLGKRKEVAKNSTIHCRVSNRNFINYNYLKLVLYVYIPV